MKAYAVNMLVPLLICVVCLAEESMSDSHLKNLRSLRQHLRTTLLENLRGDEFPELEPVALDLRRIVNGEASDTNIKNIRKFVLHLLARNENADNKMHASTLATILYIFEGDLQAARTYTEETGEFVIGLMGFIARPDASVRQAVLQELDAGDFADYIVDVLALKTARRTRTFYQGGPRSFSSREFFYLEFLAQLPQSSKRDRLLLNYAFERTGSVWQVYADRERVEDMISRWPGRKWHPPEDTWTWYYSKVVQEAGLEEEFKEQLELMNLQRVIRSLAKAEADETGQ